MDKGKRGYLGCSFVWFGSLNRAPMVTDAILLWDGFKLATLSMDKGKCGYLGCISGWFGALRGAPMVTDG